MGIKIDGKSMRIVGQYTNTCIDIVHEEINRHLSYLGEMCVSRIRNRSGAESWFDQTGNLRSSIGYSILNEGRSIIESAFQQVLNGSEGSAKGRSYINELAKKYQHAYALLVVAGMNYADRVEALENKDVLASTDLWAKSQIDEYMKKAKSKALERIRGVKL